MPPKITSNSSPPPTPAESIAETLEPGPRREPTLRRTNVSQFAQPPPSPPPTNSLAAGPEVTDTEEEQDNDTVLVTRAEQHDTATPPPPPPLPPRALPSVPSGAKAYGELSAQNAPAPAIKVSQETNNQHSSIPVFADTAPSSTVSAFLNSSFTHRDLESLPQSSAGLSPATTPGPQLDRRATTGNQRTPPATMAPPHPPAPASVSFGEIISRPSTQSPANVSLKEIGKVGTSMGKSPIDYLKPNGSLPAPVSPYFHPSQDPSSLDPPPGGETEVDGIFGNLNYMLESYLSILSSGGSVAVGTGYRSVARRLLERVEGMFARDLGVPGIGWAEVLEYIRGERTKPPLCIIPVRGLLSRKEEEKSELSHDEPVDHKDLAESVVAGIKQKPAMGKVAEWLEQVGNVLKEEDSSAEARQLAISQEQEEEEDRIVCEIIEGILIKNTEEEQLDQFRHYLENSSLIASTSLALSRLYPENTLASITPPIAALYLLLHPDLHALLAATANVTSAELDLLNSGRFDAFLDGASNVVARDEEEELNVITALDKRLWTVLEGLENQIEDLHTRALVVRRALKSRKEIITKKQKLLNPSSPVSRSSSPAPKVNRPDADDARAHDEEDWAHNVPTLNLPITPDDSASNIASNRRRRKERSSALDDSGSRREKSGSKREKSRLKKVDEEGKPGFSPQRISVREYGGTVDGESDLPESQMTTRRRRKKDRDGESTRTRSKSRHRGDKERVKHHHGHEKELEQAKAKAREVEQAKAKARPS